MGGKTAAFNQRIRPELRARLDRIFSNYGVPDAVIAEDVLSAVADYIEGAGGYKRPIRVVFDEAAAVIGLAAEKPQGGYGAATPPPLSHNLPQDALAAAKAEFAKPPPPPAPPDPPESPGVAKAKRGKRSR